MVLLLPVRLDSADGIYSSTIFPFYSPLLGRRISVAFGYSYEDEFGEFGLKRATCADGRVVTARGVELEEFERLVHEVSACVCW